MNIMSEVLVLSKQAGIPDNIVARKMLGVSRATIFTWHKTNVPEARLAQVTALRNTLQSYLDAGILPMPREELIWQGLVHVTECVPNKTK